jgi:hypothetical protein
MAELVRLQPPGRSNNPHTNRSKAMATRTFQIQTGHWFDNQGGHGMTLHVEDETSGVCLLDLKLTPEQAYDLMRGSTQNLTGIQTDNLERVGRQMVNQSVIYSANQLDDVPWDDRDGKLAKAVEMAKVDLPGWDSYEPRHNNAAGVVVVARKWVELDENGDVMADDWETISYSEGDKS